MDSQRNKHVAKAAKKLGLSVEQCAQIVVYNHELNNLMPKSSLRKIHINLQGDAMALVRKVAKLLKVDEDAVIGSMLISYLDSQEAKNA